MVKVLYIVQYTRVRPSFSYCSTVLLLPYTRAALFVPCFANAVLPKHVLLLLPSTKVGQVCSKNPSSKSSHRADRAKDAWIAASTSRTGRMPHRSILPKPILRPNQRKWTEGRREASLLSFPRGPKPDEALARIGRSNAPTDSTYIQSSRPPCG